MPTLGEACTLLHVTRKTLDHWLKYCQVEPKPHPLDGRFSTITDAELQKVADTLAQRPTLQHRELPRNASPGFTRAKSEASPARVGMMHPPRVPVSSEQGLPDGLMGLTDFCWRHPWVPRTTIKSAIAEGRLDATRGHWLVDRHWHEYALSAEQQAAALAMWPEPKPRA